MAVLDNKLNRKILGVHVGHLSFNIRVSHYSGGEDHRQVPWSHLTRLAKPHIVTGWVWIAHKIFALSRCYTRKMKHEEFETILVLPWQLIENILEMGTLLWVACEGCCIQLVLNQLRS